MATECCSQNSLFGVSSTFHSDHTPKGSDSPLVHHRAGLVRWLCDVPPFDVHWTDSTWVRREIEETLVCVCVCVVYVHASMHMYVQTGDLTSGSWHGIEHRE